MISLRWLRQQARRIASVGRTLLLTGICVLPPAQAHLMAVQRATLNITEDGAYMVLSLPSDAFSGLAMDDDGDGKLSIAELRAHQAQLEQAVRSSVQVSDAQGALPLEALLINFDIPHASPEQALAVIALAKYSLRSPAQAQRWDIGLWGQAPRGSKIEATVTRSGKPGAPLERQVIYFSREHPTHALFPPAAQVLTDYAALGARHILDGADHLLFLLVVLAAGTGWAALLLTLSAFTLGHATTLAASVLAGWSVAPALAEPAIALTIILMALFDYQTRKRAIKTPVWQRMALVFGCALVHGMGFASSLQAIGLDQNHLLLSLVGFNLGIEAIQIAIAAVVFLLLGWLRRKQQALVLEWIQRVTLGAAVGLACVWLVQRVQ